MAGRYETDAEGNMTWVTDDPYEFADYTEPDGSQHAYTPPPPAEGPIPDGYVPSPYPPPGVDPYDSVTHYVPGQPGAPQGTTPPPPGPTPPPPPPGPQPPGGGGSGGGRVPGNTDYPIAGGQKFFQYPDWTPPPVQFGQFKAPSFDAQPFSYQDFQGPTAETFQADPGYEFRASQMDRAVKNNRGASGLLRTGGTLTDLMEMRGGLASQEFGNVWNRQKQTYDTNRGNARDTWAANYQGETDEFSRALTSYLTEETGKENEWMRSRDLFTTNLGKEMGSYGMNLDTSKLNLGKDMGQYGNLLSLYQLMAKPPTYSPTV